MSYNVISDLLGLKTLGQGHAVLATLYLQGNQVSSIDHIIDCLDGLGKLKVAVFSQNGESNPVCNHPKYRSLVMSMLSNLQVLDGCDCSGQQVELEYYSLENAPFAGILYIYLSF